MIKMPNTREKLIELLRNTRHEYRRYIAIKDYEKRIAKTDEEFLAVDDSIVGEIPFCADHLIANGVIISKMETVETDNNVGHKWIPVTERVPEIGDTYLVVVKYKYDWEDDYTIDTDVAMFHPYDNPDAYIDNRWDTYIDWDEGQQYLHVTHWMPLPEPPKGE